MVHLEKDITVLYVEAASFPEGVLQAHQKLRRLLPSVEGRTFYGISYPSISGNIVYKAAVAEEYDSEAEKYSCKIFTIRKGYYLCKTLSNWRENEAQIGQTFRQILADPRIAADGYCLEVYVSDEELRCMVPVKVSSTIES